VQDNEDVTPATDPNRQGFGSRDFDEFAQPRVGDVYIDRDASATQASAGDTLTGTTIHACRDWVLTIVTTGATSQDVHQGYGHPGSGQTRAERDHEGNTHRKRNRIPAELYGSGVVPKDESEIDRSRPDPYP
jgi:hypothetical protein